MVIRETPIEMDLTSLNGIRAVPFKSVGGGGGGEERKFFFGGGEGSNFELFSPPPPPLNFAGEGGCWILNFSRRPRQKL